MHDSFGKHSLHTFKDFKDVAVVCGIEIYLLIKTSSLFAEYY